MGHHKDYYCGAFIKVPHVKYTRTITKWKCPQCKTYKDFNLENYCAKCGTGIVSEQSTEDGVESWYDLIENMGLDVDALSVVFGENFYYLISNKPKTENTHVAIQENEFGLVTSESIDNYKLHFRQAFKEEILKIKDFFKMDGDIVDFGICYYYD